MERPSEALAASGVEGPQPHVVVARGDGGTQDKAYFPTVEKLLDGSLAVVFYSSPQHVGSNGRILFTTSHDGGETWTDSRGIVNTCADDRDPSLSQLRDGRLILNWFQYQFDSGGQRRNRVLVSVSEDRGDTWSDPLPVETGFTSSATSAKILELPSGELLLPIYGRTEGESVNRTAIARSRDGGEHWLQADESSLAQIEGVTLSEPALARYHDGTIVALIRSDTGGNQTYHCLSDDDGRTWTAPEAVTGMRWHAPDLLTLSDTGHDRVVATGGDVSGSMHPSRAVVGRIVENGGSVNGHPPRLLYASPTGGRDMSYPSTVELRPGELFTVYYDATYPDPAKTMIAGTWWRADAG